MVGLKIDLDDGILYEVPVSRRPRGGVVMRKDPDTGADVFMYRNRPGIYYSSNGLEVSPTLARKAGFDVDRLEIERQKIQKMKEFEQEYNAQMNISVRRVVVNRGNFRLVDLGENRYIVEDIEGRNMTAGKQATTEQMGLAWLEHFAGPEVVNDNVSSTDGQSVGGVDRRSEPDGDANRVVRKPGRPKASVSA